MVLRAVLVQAMKQFLAAPIPLRTQQHNVYYNTKQLREQ